jgi:hypothetical protein
MRITDTELTSLNFTVLWFADHFRSQGPRGFISKVSHGGDGILYDVYMRATIAMHILNIVAQVWHSMANHDMPWQLKVLVLL